MGNLRGLACLPVGFCMRCALPKRSGVAVLKPLESQLGVILIIGRVWTSALFSDGLSLGCMS
jgi:hypothetical protein